MHDHARASARLTALEGADAHVSRRRALRLGLGAAAAVGVTGSRAATASAARAAEPKVFFRDDFIGAPGTSPDPAKWTLQLGNGRDGWGNKELQNYTASTRNAMVDGNGYLVITGRHENGGWTSARMTTEDSFTFRHGVVEARMKLPPSTGSWPAFWLLPKDAPARLESGEIDIMERSGWELGTTLGALHGTGHSTKESKISKYTLSGGQEFSAGWHRFRVRKEPGRITWYVDGHQFHQVTRADVSLWPFEDYNYYLILNQAIGGTLGGDPTTGRWPQQMLVDYVWVTSL